MVRLVAQSQLPFAVEDVFAWHLRPGALERLTPPWERARVLERSGGIADGGRVVLGVPFGPFTLRWEARHGDFVPGERFVDAQERGPFRRWVHAHRFAPTPAGCLVEDELAYALPLGALGRAVAGEAVRARLERMFAFRHARLAADLERQTAVMARPAAPLRIAVSGASGLIGRALCAFLSTAGHEVLRLVRRRPAGAGEIGWDPQRGEVDRTALAGVDVVVHLAGANIGARWSAARKRVIRDSRVDGTRTLAEAIARLPVPPRAFICASAIGFYGDRGDELVDENSAAGDGFLAWICRVWEAAASAAEQAGVRVVNARLGTVLTPEGGALARMLPAFRLGAGGPIGDGTQPVSWISVDDAVYALHHAILDERLHGPINLTAPAPVTQGELARTLGDVLGRPAELHLSRTAVSALFGEMGRALLLGGARVAPRRLVSSGYRFEHPTLAAALPALLGRGAALAAPACALSYAAG